MIDNEIAARIIRYGQARSTMGLDNLFSGFLTNEIKNKIDDEDAKGIALQFESIVKELVKQIVSAGVIPSTDECSTLFQYVFDKVAEATYKIIVNEDVNVELNIGEAFEYYEPDLPYYIQQKITNAVEKIVTVCSDTLSYIDDNGYRTEDIEYWFLPLLLLSVSLAMHFVLEMNLDDDSELRHYLGED